MIPPPAGGGAQTKRLSANYSRIMFVGTAVAVRRFRRYLSQGPLNAGPRQVVG